MEYTFTINEIDFTIGQIPYGKHKDKWCWSTATDEGKPCDTAAAGFQDALDGVQAKVDDERLHRDLEEEAAVYGSYAEQMRQHYNSTRL